MNTFKIYEELKPFFPPESAEGLARVLSRVVDDVQNTVTKTEFAGLRQITQNLVGAHQASEPRFTRLETALTQLAEAQKRTEIKLEELVEAQKRTEIRLEELVEAQKRTEIRLEQLATRVEELAVAQRKTDERLDRLTLVVDRLVDGLAENNRQLGGLAMTVGYTLENEAFKHLGRLLSRDWQINLLELPYRGYLKDSKDRPWEVNIIAKGERNGQPFLVVGESKAQLSKRHIESFLDHRFKALAERHGPLFPVIVAHMASEPDTLEYAQSKGVAVYLSYQFER